MISHNTLKTTLKLCHGFVVLSVKSVNASEPNDKFVSCGLIDLLFARAWVLSLLLLSALKIYAASWLQGRLIEKMQVN